MPPSMKADFYSIFALIGIPLRCPAYARVSKRAKSVDVSFKTPSRGEVAHRMIDSTGLTVFGEGEWKVKKHGNERRRIWRKRHLAVDAKTHEIIWLIAGLIAVTAGVLLFVLHAKQFLGELQKLTLWIVCSGTLILATFNRSLYA